jgi:hypothetical protein
MQDSLEEVLVREWESVYVRNLGIMRVVQMLEVWKQALKVEQLPVIKRGSVKNEFLNLEDIRVSAPLKKSTVSFIVLDSGDFEAANGWYFEERE